MYKELKIQQVLWQGVSVGAMLNLIYCCDSENCITERSRSWTVSARGCSPARALWPLGAPSVTGLGPEDYAWSAGQSGVLGAESLLGSGPGALSLVLKLKFCQRKLKRKRPPRVGLRCLFGKA